MDDKVFNSILKNLRMLARHENHVFRVPLTRYHRLDIFWNKIERKINSMDLLEFPSPWEQVEVAIYCHSCPNKVFQPHQIEKMEKIIQKRLHQFDNTPIEIELFGITEQYRGK